VPTSSEPPRRRVALTFDDGPDPVWTPRVLRALAGVRVRGTFFVISARAVRHPQLIAAAVEQGHEIGLHCARHVRHTQATRGEIEIDTATALGALARLGVRPRRWRLPWGAHAEWSTAVARSYGLTIVDWTADTHDWRGDAAPVMLDAVASRLGPGGVVLLHDGLGPGSLRAGCPETVRLIGPLAAEIRRRGCEPSSVAAMAGVGACV
jgi:peptidoglycan/xylan/chitin deacetylase (PgdA/CDA1 family)